MAKMILGKLGELIDQQHRDGKSCLSNRYNWKHKKRNGLF